MRGARPMAMRCLAGRVTKVPRLVGRWVPEEKVMAITVMCRCGRKFTAKDEQVGKRFPCPNCGATVEVRPAAVSQPVARPTAGESKGAG